MKTVRQLIEELNALTEEQKDMLALGVTADDWGTRFFAVSIREAIMYDDEGRGEFEECHLDLKNCYPPDVAKLNLKKVIVIE